MLRVLSLVVAILFVLATRPSLSEAQIYRWVDDRGVPHYSEGIDSIPAQSRKTAVPLELRNAPVSPSGPAPAGAEASGATIPAGATTIRVKFVKGYGFIVDATINGTTAAKLIADTGAERTQITPRVLTAAGALPAKEPSGTTSPPTVQIASLAVGGLRVERLSVGVVSPIDDRENVDGLLGRDFLDRFQVLIDTDNGIATLSPKSQ
jgi:hypothetical protein